jgi:hypothetical protein
MGTRSLAAIATVAGLTLLSHPAQAQISPGPLSAPHAKVEGSENCLKCHDPKKGIAPEKCLECHGPLRERIQAGRGLHARPEYRRCETCHVEHHGREVDLVWWGDKGRAAFDHQLTGYSLEGKHSALQCPACHAPKAGATTYLGLKTTCTPCHADPHGGQFGSATCQSCHGQEAWKPARFDHSKTAYPLTGLHAAVACDKCHPSVKGPGGESRKFKGIAFASCTSCHDDPHQGKLGATCTQCHTTSGWRRYDAKAFDHARTAYPLAGRHAAVACDKCHAPGRPLRFKHDQCTDCHADTHRGQFIRRADKGRCDACHSVTGFSPASYGPDEHRASTYPLVGAHLAIPCDACHRRDAQRLMRFRFASTRCLDCHKDPHNGELDRYAPRAGCESCHKVDSWRAVTFDHSRTPFVLTGGHLRAACAACHKKSESGSEAGRMKLAGLPVSCAGCHRDVHARQFADPKGATACERCHETASWKAPGFVHDRDASYRLEGAHARVPCGGCHRTEGSGDARFVRYKPLGKDCRDCHGAASVGVNP